MLSRRVFLPVMALLVLAPGAKGANGVWQPRTPGPLAFLRRAFDLAEVSHNLESTFVNRDYTRQPVFWQLVILMVILIVLFSSAIVRELSDTMPVAKPPVDAAAQQQAAAAVGSQLGVEYHSIDLSGCMFVFGQRFETDQTTSGIAHRGGRRLGRGAKLPNVKRTGTE